MKPAQSILDMRLRALADPTRRQILLRVSQVELTAGSIADLFDVARPTISRHLKMLRDAGFVTIRQVGTQRRYRSDTVNIQEMISWFQMFGSDASLNQFTAI